MLQRVQRGDSDQAVDSAATLGVAALACIEDALRLEEEPRVPSADEQDNGLLQLLVAVTAA
eukprot:CAMPEP_0179172120 /NCGR_PEP_ID=MMETSP0796-20121207/84875_1 /TAXON_ID=73915 /ORGANISM="Pyrodinium bahamense, Strain pbaha01" /LENGTH=60 /DNA_ID=CAMNT_0020875239 /DNA_START=1 /DNA_END=179 /DNA_ORIENTATION=-